MPGIQRAKETENSHEDRSGVLEKNGSYQYILDIKNRHGERSKTALIKLSGKPSNDEAIEAARTRALGKLIHESIKSGDRDWSDLVLPDLDFSKATAAYLNNDEPTDLSRFNFSGCLITSRTKNGPGTTFRNTILNNTVFDNIIAGTFDIRGATCRTPVSMCGVRIQTLKGAGSDLFNPLLRGAKIKEIDLINSKNRSGDAIKIPANWIAPIFSQAEIKGGTIEKASLPNGDWGNSVTIGVDARGADLSDTMRDEINASLAKGLYKASELTIKANDFKVERILRSKEFPNKTRNAVFVNLTIDKETQLNGMNRRSLKISNAVRKVSKIGFTAAALLLMATVDMTGFSWVDAATSSLGKGNILIVTAALDFMKSKVFEDLIGAKLREKASQAIVSGQRNVVEKARSLRERMHNLRVVFGGRDAIEPLMRAIQVVGRESKKPGRLKSLYRAIKGDGGVLIVCDKRMLAKAISNISSNRNRKYQVKRDVTLTRVGVESNSAVASTLTFHKNGDKSLSYIEDGKVILVSANENGEVYSTLEMGSGNNVVLSNQNARGIIDNENGKRSIKGAINLFERAVLNQNGLKDFSYDPDESYVASGESGRTMFVHNRNTRKLHSRAGPALVHLDKSSMNTEKCWVEEYFIDGEYKSEKEYKSENQKHDRAVIKALKTPDNSLILGLEAARKRMLEQCSKSGYFTPAQKTAIQRLDEGLKKFGM